MQVNHVDDHVTHALIGGEEKIEFSISSDASFFQILSSTLYSDQMLAVVREVVCNAWDAHIDAGITDKPIRITVDSDKIVFEDFGSGIAKNMMGPIYATYGASTKANDGKATGGFGLGCKAPFAYTDNFEVTSSHGGIKTIYRISKSSSEVGGKPSITPIVSVPCQESGLKVSINLKMASDRHRFTTLIKRIVANGGIKAEINGTIHEVLPIEQMKRGFILTQREVLENRQEVCIRYGNVIYPLEMHAEYASDYNHASRIVDSKTSGSHWTLVLQADPHTISVTPSRESLSMQERTIGTVKALLEKFNRLDFNQFNAECFDAVKERIDNILMEGTDKDVIEDFLKTRNESYYRRHNSTKIQDIFNTKDFARSFMEHRYPSDGAFRRKELLYGLKRLIMDPKTTMDKWLLVKMRDELVRYAPVPKGRGHMIAQESRVKGWGKRYLVAPITSKMRGNDDVKADRLYAVTPTTGWNSNVYNGDARLVSATAFHCQDLSGYLRFLRKIVIITHSRNGIWDRVRQFSGYQDIFNDNITGFVYQVPRIPKKVKAVREFFKNSGMQVVDLTLEIEYEEPGFTAGLRAEKKAKKEGYTTLSACLVNGRFLQDQMKNEDAARVEKPEFFTFLNARSAKYTSTADLPMFSNSLATKITKLWGDKGAAILTGAQADKLLNSGVPLIDKFVSAKLVEFFKDNKQIETWLGGSMKRASELSNVEQNVLQLFWDCPEMATKFNLGQPLPVHETRMYELFKEIRKLDPNHPELSEIQAKWDKVDLCQASKDLIDLIQASKSLRYVSKYELMRGLVSQDKPTKTHAINFLIKALKG